MSRDDYQTLFKNSIVIQRKGGNGVHVHGIKDKGDPTHPGNNIQIKLKVNHFIEEMEKYKDHLPEI